MRQADSDIPGAVHNFYSTVSKEAEQLLSTENLLYTNQLTADEKERSLYAISLVIDFHKRPSFPHAPSLSHLMSSNPQQHPQPKYAVILIVSVSQKGSGLVCEYSKNATRVE